jgi:hypothetical protein
MTDRIHHPMGRHAVTPREVPEAPRKEGLASNYSVPERSHYGQVIAALLVMIFVAMLAFAIAERT